MANLDREIDKEPNWYVLHTYSGYESIAKQNLEIVVDKYNLQDRIFDIIIPMEDELVEKRGKKELVPRKMMPGYIIVKMKYGDDIWHAVTRTQYITGFVGPKGRPVPITPDEVQRLHLERIVTNNDVKVGDRIEIVDGPLATFVGVVTSVDMENGKLKANVEMFGRETEVELNINQIRVAS